MYPAASGLWEVTNEAISRKGSRAKDVVGPERTVLWASTNSYTSNINNLLTSNQRRILNA